MRKLTNIVRPILNQVISPALIIYSKRDVLSLRGNFDMVFDNISSNIKETLVLEKSTHNIFTKSSEQQIVFNKILSFFQERL
jgi:esterase/lipase